MFRCLATALGRPCLVPPQYVRTSLPQIPEMSEDNAIETIDHTVEAFTYFNRLM